MGEMNAKRKVTLVNLVSGQIMQNLLPAMVLRPDRIVWFYSEGERKGRLSEERLRADVKGLQGVESVGRPLGTKSPTSEETREKVEAFLREEIGGGAEDLFVINFTGGTKMMSIGVFLAGEKFANNCVMLYCDTQEKRFFCHGKGENPLWEELPEMDFSEVWKGLTVERMVKLHAKEGNEKFQVSDPPEENWVEFARGAYGMWEKGRDRLAKEVEKIQEAKAGLCAGTEALPVSQDSAEVTEYLRLAVKCGFLRESEGRFFILQEEGAGKKKRESWAIKVVDLLVGKWLEVYCYDVLDCAIKEAEAKRKLPRFLDLSWSVKKQGEGEVDLLCIDAEKLVLRSISVKNTLPKTTDIGDHSTHTKMLGGTFADAYLCCCPKDSQNNEKENRKQLAQQNGISMLMWEEIAERLVK